jgi:hypothetical protein
MDGEYDDITQVKDIGIRQNSMVTFEASKIHPKVQANVLDKRLFGVKTYFWQRACKR